MLLRYQIKMSFKEFFLLVWLITNEINLSNDSFYQIEAYTKTDLVFFEKNTKTFHLIWIKSKSKLKLYLPFLPNCLP